MGDKDLLCAACERPIELGALVVPVYRTFMSRGGQTIVLATLQDHPPVAHYPQCPPDPNASNPVTTLA